MKHCFAGRPSNIYSKQYFISHKNENTDYRFNPKFREWRGKEKVM